MFHLIHKYRKPVEGEVGYATHNKVCDRCFKLTAPKSKEEIEAIKFERSYTKVLKKVIKEEV